MLLTWSSRPPGSALGCSASQTGVRLLIITAGMFVAATVSGRLSSHVPVRWLIGPGLLLVGIGLALMSGLNGTSTRTHLIPGFLVAGVGSGLVNPPLASTAIGVVEPQRAGMASGVNTTFRQVGIAVATAGLGTIFVSALRRSLSHSLAAVPALAGHASAIAAQVQQGNFGAVLASVPPGQRGRLEAAAHSAFAAGLNDLLLVSAAVALVGGVASIALIRSRDFVMCGRRRGCPRSGWTRRRLARHVSPSSVVTNPTRKTTRDPVGNYGCHGANRCLVSHAN